MSRKKAPKTPSYRCHKPTGQGFVELNGHRHYLGRFDDPKTRERYDRTVGEWMSNGRRLPMRPAEVLIVELASAFWTFSQGYYKHPGGGLTSSVGEYKLVLRMLQEMYGSAHVGDFGPRQYKAVRAAMIDAGWCRKVINQRCGLLKRVFKWGVAEGLVALEVDGCLRTVEGLRRGRTEARESVPVRPVSESMVDATLPYLTPTLQGMVQVQRLTGMRTGEVVLMRGCDLDMGGAVWTFRPEHHKTDYRGRDRVIYLGPKAQGIVHAFLRPDTMGYLFSPIRSERERRDAMHEARTTPLSCGNTPGSNCKIDPVKKPRERYDTSTYARAIKDACDRAFQPPEGLPVVELKTWRKEHRWSPGRLRHNFATGVRRDYGLESAQVLLGHAAADVTQIYAERDAERAVAVAMKVG